MGLSCDHLDGLVRIIGDLARTRTRDEVACVVSGAVRSTLGSDGAAVVFRQGDSCYYADEDCIAPLWKGQTFPMQNCVAGWAMLHGQSIAIEDVFSDSRASAEVYQKTFVKGLAVAPVRPADPLGAIGAYWSSRHRIAPEAMEFLAALAETVSLALENAALRETTHVLSAELSLARGVKDEFLRLVSHELRTPLNAILGWSSLLAVREELEPGMAKGLDIIERSTLTLSHRVDDLLDMSLILSGQLDLDLRKVDFAKIVAQTVENVRDAFAAKNVSLDVALGRSSAWVLGDQDRLRQICWNLLDNALKFTPSGRRVEVRLLHEGPQARLAIRDSGEGFDATSVESLFDRFTQADTTLTRRHGGMGIGLNLVKHLVEAHGGRISASSEGRGKGATFSFAVPLKSLESVPVRDPFLADSETGLLRGTRVLVADDNAEQALLLEEILKLQGAEIRVARESHEVRRLVQEFRPQVCIFDFAASEGELRSGIESLKRAERRPGVLVLGVHQIREEVDGGLAPGEFSFLRKPVHPRRIVEIVGTLATQSGSPHPSGAS